MFLFDNAIQRTWFCWLKRSLVQLLLGKRCYKPEFKWIQAYRNRLRYCPSQTFQAYRHQEWWNSLTLLSYIIVSQQSSWDINPDNILHHNHSNLSNLPILRIIFFLYSHLFSQHLLPPKYWTKRCCKNSIFTI